MQASFTFQQTEIYHEKERTAAWGLQTQQHSRFAGFPKAHLATS